MLYKIQKYQSKYSSFSAEVKQRFDQVKQLSRNFTVINESAQDLDEALFPIIQFQVDGKVETKQLDQTEVEEIKKDFTELFTDIIKNATHEGGGGGDVNVEQVEAIVAQSLQNLQIGSEQLSNELKAKFNSVSKIQYVINNKELPAIPMGDIPEFQQMVDELMLGHNIFLIGGAGTGKTTLAKKVADSLDRKYITINCSQWTSPIDIIGGQSMEGYKEGRLIRAWTEGMILILDEMPKLDPNTAGLLNDALAESDKPEGTIIFNGLGVPQKKHKNFCVIATGNIYPNGESMAYGGNNKQDLSLLDRFTGSIYWIEKNESLERRIIKGITGSEAATESIWRISDLTRSIIEKMKYEAQLSLRFMISLSRVWKLQQDRFLNDRKIKHDEGITAKKYIDAYLSTFTKNQRDVIMKANEYDILIFKIESAITEKN